MVLDAHFKTVLDRLTSIFDAQNRHLEDVQAGLDFLEANRAADPFVRVIALVASNHVTEAACRVKQQRDARTDEIKKKGVKGEVQLLRDEIVGATQLPRNFREHVSDARQVALSLAAECSGLSVDEASSTFSDTWLMLVEVFDHTARLHLVPLLSQLVGAADCGFVLNETQDDWLSILPEDAANHLSHWNYDAAFFHDAFSLGVGSHQQKPYMKSVVDELTLKVAALQSRLSFGNGVSKMIGSASESFDDLASHECAEKVSDLCESVRTLEGVGPSAVDERWQWLAGSLRCLIGKCGKFAQAMAKKLMEPAREEFHNLLQVEHRDRLFAACGSEADMTAEELQSPKAAEVRLARHAHFSKFCLQGKLRECHRNFTNMAAMTQGPEAQIACALADWELRLQEVRAHLAKFVCLVASLDAGEHLQAATAQLAEAAINHARLNLQKQDLDAKGSDLNGEDTDELARVETEMAGLQAAIVAAVKHPNCMRLTSQPFVDSKDAVDLAMGNLRLVVGRMDFTFEGLQARPWEKTACQQIVHEAEQLVLSEEGVLRKKLELGMHCAVQLALPFVRDYQSMADGAISDAAASASLPDVAAIPHLIVELGKMAKAARVVAQVCKGGTYGLELCPTVALCEKADNQCKDLRMWLGCAHAVHILHSVIPQTKPADLNDVKQEAVAKLRQCGVLNSLPMVWRDQLASTD